MDLLAASHRSGSGEFGHAVARMANFDSSAAALVEQELHEACRSRVLMKAHNSLGIKSRLTHRKKGGTSIGSGAVVAGAKMVACACA